MKTINKLDKDTIKCLNATNDFCKVLNKHYKGHISSMKSGVYCPPIAGKYKGQNIIDEKLAFNWALNETLACGSDTIKGNSKRRINENS